MFIVLAIGPKVCGFKSSIERCIFKVDTIYRTTSFRGEVKLLASCRKILWHVKDPLRYDRYNDRQNSAPISCQVCPHFTTSCLLQPKQRTLANESEVISPQMGRQ
jgi:hypothetical protein